MEKVILIRYGEIFLKGKNKRYFEELLYKNIANAVSGLTCRLESSQSRLFIVDFNESSTDKLISKLTKVFGIHSMSIAYKIPTDMKIISELAQEIAPEKGSFRVNVKRADKTINMTSTEIASQIGGDILQNNKNLTVDLHNPDKVISIDIRENKYTYIYYDIIKGQEGMPVGCSGKGMLLLSGGIDSPVAGYRMAKRGMQLSAIHYHSYPFTSPQAKQKVIELAEKLTEYCGIINLTVVPFTKIQQAIHEYCREDFMITVMRMIMVRIAERIAKNNKCGALITGESLGQVASQTLQSITVTNSQVTDLPIFRPLIGMDKTEIIDVSKKIDTFDTSILPYEDCCTVFLPKNPIIKPSLKVALSELHKIPNLSELIEESIADIETIIIHKNNNI